MSLCLVNLGEEKFREHLNNQILKWPKDVFRKTDHQLKPLDIKIW